MSITDSKMEQHRDTAGPARRTYASLSEARGFIAECWWRNYKAVSIAPMGKPSFWLHVGSGSPVAKDAMYEEVTP